jgi:hypothetical protein
MTPWLPAHAEWADAAGTVWTRAWPHRLAEQDARRLVRRSSTRVAIERTHGSPDVEWLDPAAQKGYWDRRIAGHVEDGTAAPSLTTPASRTASAAGGIREAAV